MPRRAETSPVCPRSPRGELGPRAPSGCADLPEWLRQTLFVVVGSALRSGPSTNSRVSCSANLSERHKHPSGAHDRGLRGACHFLSRRHIWFLTTVFLSPRPMSSSPAWKRKAGRLCSETHCPFPFFPSAFLLCTHFTDEFTEAQRAAGLGLWPSDSGNPIEWEWQEGLGSRRIRLAIWG